MLHRFIVSTAVVLLLTTTAPAQEANVAELARALQKFDARTYPAGSDEAKELAESPSKRSVRFAIASMPRTSKPGVPLPTGPSGRPFVMLAC